VNWSYAYKVVKVTILADCWKNLLFVNGMILDVQGSEPKNYQKTLQLIGERSGTT
jgi:hypothetical protein